MSRNSQKIRNHIFRNRYRQKSCSSLRSGDTRSHFLIQSVPNYSPTEIVTIIKSLTAKHIFLTRPEVKKQLWDVLFSKFTLGVVSFGQMVSLLIQFLSLEVKKQSPLMLGIKVKITNILSYTNN